MKRANVVEIGPRDGFQSVGEFIPTEVKLQVIDGLNKLSQEIWQKQGSLFVSERESMLMLCLWGDTGYYYFQRK